MPFPRRLARFNRRIANPAIGTFARLLPPLAVVVHRGRTSGRRYRTPVIALAVEDGYVIAQMYAGEADWVRNVVAAQSCVLERAGRRITPTGVQHLGAEGLGLVPAAVRPVLRMLEVERFVKLQARLD